MRVARWGAGHWYAQSHRVDLNIAPIRIPTITETKLILVGSRTPGSKFRVQSAQKPVFAEKELQPSQESDSHQTRDAVYILMMEQINLS